MSARLVVLLLLVGCEGKLGSTPPPGGLLQDGGCPPQGKTDELRQALAPACASCHLTGNKPYFASLAAFENGIAYDERWVVRGDPDSSPLIGLLLGQAPGSYPQMPPNEPFAAYTANGRITVSLDDVKQWIRDLPARGTVNEGPVPENFTIRRLRADEMILSLMDQLGLVPEDFVDTTSPNWRNEAWTPRGGRLFVWPTDWAPGISQQYVSDKRATERYETLGGAVVLQGRKNDLTLGPSSVQTVVQMSQAWCRLAIQKAGNDAVLRYVTLADKSATKSPEIRKNIAQLSLRMLGDEATEAEITELYEQVYLPLEPASTTAAWTAVCSALVRHPKWLSY